MPGDTLGSEKDDIVEQCTPKDTLTSLAKLKNLHSTDDAIYSVSSTGSSVQKFHTSVTHLQRVDSASSGIESKEELEK